eukprot:1964416-Rhodomonas_salina.2
MCPSCLLTPRDGYLPRYLLRCAVLGPVMLCRLGDGGVCVFLDAFVTVRHGGRRKRHCQTPCHARARGSASGNALSGQEGSTHTPRCLAMTQGVCCALCVACWGAGSLASAAARRWTAGDERGLGVSGAQPQSGRHERRRGLCVGQRRGGEAGAGRVAGGGDGCCH